MRQTGLSLRARWTQDTRRGLASKGVNGSKKKLGERPVRGACNRAKLC